MKKSRTNSISGHAKGIIISIYRQMETEERILKGKYF